MDQWLVCLNTDHEVAGSIPGTSANFKSELSLERGQPSHVRTIGLLLDEKVADLIKKADIIRLDGLNANHIIPSYCHLPFSCKSLVDQCGSFGSYKHRINLFSNPVHFSIVRSMRI